MDVANDNNWKGKAAIARRDLIRMFNNIGEIAKKTIRDIVLDLDCEHCDMKDAKPTYYIITITDDTGKKTETKLSPEEAEPLLKKMKLSPQ